MSYIIDADWIIQMTRGNQLSINIVDRLRTTAVYVSWFTVAEVYEGAFRSPNPQAGLGFLRQYTDMFTPIGMDGDIAEHYAEIRAFLRRRGIRIQDADMVVAATALSRDLTVLTYNRRHFERIPDLRVYRVES